MKTIKCKKLPISRNWFGNCYNDMYTSTKVERNHWFMFKANRFSQLSCQTQGKVGNMANNSPQPLNAKRG